MTQPPVLILHATGTNRDRDAAWACELAGGAPEIVHVNRLAAGQIDLANYRMLVLPGGFSYGDDLGAGKVWAMELRHRLADALAEFVASGRPVLGICNGFQVLVKAGLLPGDERPNATGKEGSPFVPRPAPPEVTLTRNDSGRFECRWVYLEANPASPCIFTRGLAEPIYCPVAHGEGKFVAATPDVLAELEATGLAALRYGIPGIPGMPAMPGIPHMPGTASNSQPPYPAGESGYPWNPNGSQNAIAGICNPQGTVFGLMPHPEDHIRPEQHPSFRRSAWGNSGLPLFQNGVRYAAAL